MADEYSIFCKSSELGLRSSPLALTLPRSHMLHTCLHCLWSRVGTVCEVRWLLARGRYTLSFLLIVVGYGMWSTAELAANEIPLEYYHFPLWFKLGLMPSPLLRKGARQHIRTMAEKRAKDLKSRAWKEKSLGSSATSFLSSTTTQRSSSRNSIGYLLRKAANTIGRGNVDVSKYEERLADAPS